MALAPAVSWPWVQACDSLEPPRRDGEDAQKTGENREKMGEIRPKTCEGRGLTKDQLSDSAERIVGTADFVEEEVFGQRAWRRPKDAPGERPEY